MKKKLPAAALKLLGKRTDTEIAVKFDCSEYTVRQARQGLNIARFDRTVFNWTQKRLDMLGRFSDGELARRWGVTVNTIGNRRRKLGIEPAEASTENKRHPWTEEQLQWLGVQADAQIAKALGLSQATVRQKREVLGIPSTRKSMRPSSTKWTKHALSLLGKLPDTKVAKLIGFSRNVVQDKRRSLGIPSQEQNRMEKIWTPEVITRLGKEPDSKIAADIGLSAGGVGLFRTRRKIPAFRSGSEK